MIRKNDKYVSIAREIILDLIEKDEVTVFLFGSRAGNSCHHNSDIDVGFLSKKKFDEKLFNRVYERLEESIVPYHVDLVDFNTADETFRKIALSRIEIWNEAKNTNIN